MVSGRKLIYFGRNFDGPLLRLDTDSSSVNFCIFPPDLGLHESTVGVALDSHIAERKPIRAHGGRKSVVYSTDGLIRTKMSWAYKNGRLRKYGNATAIFEKKPLYQKHLF